MSAYVIGVDQGTTGTSVGLMNAEGRMLAQGYRAHRQFHPQPGWVEQDPLEIWQNVCDLLTEVMQQAEVSAADIAGIGLANQGESVVMWDAASGDPLYKVIVWQDSRTQSSIDAMKQDATLAEQVRQRTGLHLDSYFSASKLRWLLDHVPEASACLQKGSLRCGTLDSWLIWKLSSGEVYVTDPSTASRTLLYNIHTLAWDDDLLAAFSIPRDLLAEVQPSAGSFGVVRQPGQLFDGIPILGSLVDQPAAMLGHGCLQVGQVKATYGTGCFINMNTAQEPVYSAGGLLTMLAWQRDAVVTYAQDGGVLTVGATLNWLQHTLQLIPSPQAIDSLCGDMSSSPVEWIPAQTGLGAPYWQRHLRAAWLNIGLDTSPADLVYAVLEGIALRVVQILRLMEADSGQSVTVLSADGGLTHCQTLMQVQADLLGCPVQVLADHEATTSGICYLVARHCGLWNDDAQITAQLAFARTYEPRLSTEQRESRLARFDTIIQHMGALGE